MIIKNYSSPEEVRSAFMKSVNMRSEYEKRVRQKWEEMQAVVNAN